VITVKIPSELEKKMKRVKVNWSEYTRDSIQKRSMSKNSNLSPQKIDEVRKRTKPVSTEELVSWIRENREEMNTALFVADPVLLQNGFCQENLIRKKPLNSKMILFGPC
jgi:hypothetical protein